MVELRPLPVTRFASMVPGALVLALGLWSGFGDGPPWVVGGGLAVLGAVLAVRGYRLGVTVTEQDVVIHGFVLTRTIPRGLVAAISDWPAVVWRSELPSLQHSRISAFRTGSRVLRSVRKHNAECIEILRRTVA